MLSIFVYLVLYVALQVSCQVQQPEDVPAPTFFISLTSVCRFNDAEMNPESTFEAKGSLCAYAAEANIVYSCPAGDAYCWNTGTQCSGGSSTSPGTNETACSDIGSGQINWCCNSQFGNCTQTPFQQNNCWSWFDNPNRNVNSLAAASLASSAMSAAVSEPTITNVVVNALATGGWVVASQTLSSSSGSASSTSSSTGTSTVSSSLATSSSSASNPESSPTLSSGAIAGIAIGAALLASLLTGLFFLRRHRRSKAANAAAKQQDMFRQDSTLEVQPSQAHYPYPHQKPGWAVGTAELTSEQRSKILYGQGTQAELDGSCSAEKRMPVEKRERDSHMPR